ncbi:ArsR/SmtB family transcription factor [Micrococcus luteus]|uniref:ArsR/SmtB family transcription factor n=1 Tax=Micrococcus luteus TaxID=1270 RepID=UPI00352E78B1
MTMIKEPGVSPTAGLGPAAALFHGFSDPTRLAILRHLATGEHKVRELTEDLGLAQSTVSAHLACLTGCGLVSSRPVGRASLYSLAAEPELLEVLAAAERLLTVTGHAVELCPHSGPAATGALPHDAGH